MNDVEDIVKQIIRDHIGATEQQTQDNNVTLVEIGADSLDGVEIVMELEERFEISIPDEALGENTQTLTIADIIRIVEEQQVS